eukprot:16684-Heterococcus_DN1.PRE.3
MMVTLMQLTAYQEILENAIHLLGKSNVPLAQCREELGIPHHAASANTDSNINTPTGNDSSGDSSDNNDDDDVGTEETKGGDDTTADTDDINAATEEFTPIKFDTERDYYLPPVLEELTDKLLGSTMRIDIYAKDQVQLIARITKLLIMLASPTFSVHAPYGLIDSVVLYLPSSSLYDSETGISTIIHDVPGMVQEDAARLLCAVKALSDGLDSTGSKIIVHMINSRQTPTEVSKSLADAGVYRHIVADVAAGTSTVHVLLVYATDYHGVLCDDEMITLNNTHYNSNYIWLTNAARQLLRRSGKKKSTSSAITALAEAAAKRIQLLTAETHPDKIAAQLRGDTTAAQPDLSQVKEAIAACSLSHYEFAVLEALDELAEEVAMLAYLSYQAKTVFETGQASANDIDNDDSASSSSTSGSRSKFIELCRPLQEKIHKKRQLMNEGVSNT